MQMRINPGVTRIEPDGEMAVLAPCRSSWLNDLLCRIRCQVFTRRGERKIALACRLANELLEKIWSFAPPVPKQFGIEGSDNNWLKTQFADSANLLPALFQKVLRMFLRRIFRCGAIIQLFLITAPGDPMIFHAGEFSASARDRPQMFEGKIETDVAVKFPVGWI